MRLKLLIAVIIAMCLISDSGFSQKVILKITDTYFRYNPFDRKFSTFLNHLLKDTLLADKAVMKTTDSTFFFFKGTYKKYSSFDLNPNRVEIRLGESEIEIQEPTPKKDTILSYQLLIYTSPGSNGKNDVQKEFERFNRKYKDGFAGVESKDLMENKKAVGIIRNYFIDFSSVPALTIAYTNSANDENVFAITIRMKVKENMALLIQDNPSDISSNPDREE